MSELTVGYGQVVMSLFTDLGIRPNILAVADNIETIKVIVQSGKAASPSCRAPAPKTKWRSAMLKALSIAPARNVALCLFRRRAAAVAPQGGLCSPCGHAQGAEWIGFTDACPSIKGF